MFINDDLSVTFGSSLNRPVYSGSLFCRLLKQAASAIPKEPSGSTSGLSW